MEDSIKSTLADFKTLEQNIAQNRHASSADTIHIPMDKIFTNCEVHLKDVSVYGFDYDYTIASYRKKTMSMSYEEAQKHMVRQMGFPQEILEIKYDPTFATQGLHFDLKKGFLIKLDQFSRVDKDSAYFGKTKVSEEELKKTYPGMRVSDGYAHKYLKIISDLFCLPLANLLADTIDFFQKQKIDFDVGNLFVDISQAFNKCHKLHTIHKRINEDISSYIRPSSKLVEYITTLLKAKKTLFMLSNNSYKYITLGCKKIFKDIVEDKSYGFSHWSEIFDVVITKASKPDWYDTDKKFRVLDKNTGNITLEVVNSFERGKIYRGGSFHEFMRITKYKMSEVIYMGDNVYNDLRAPRKFCQWRTVAIVKDLYFELEKMNQPDFQTVSIRLYKAEKLFDHINRLREKNDGKKINDFKLVVPKLKDMIKTLLHNKKNLFNEHFGSVFHTNNAATKFLHNVQRYADLYTSNVENFWKYPLDSAFFVKRRYYEHEPDYGEKRSRK